MELSRIKEAFQGLLKDRKLVQLAFILGLLGIALIYLSSWGGSHEEPEPQPEESQSAEAYRRQLEEDLRRVVRAVTGESSPEVMLTLENSGSSVYAADSRESRASEERENSHVILEDSGGSQHGLALEQRQPRIQGVVIVSRAAKDPLVREKLMNAARAALGVSSGRICVVEGG